MFQPGLIWGYARTDAGARLIDDCGDHAEAGFRWLHLNLSDQRSRGWIERDAALSPAFTALVFDRDLQPQALVEGDRVGLVLPDFERDFDAADTGRIGSLHIVLGPRLMLTGRYHPLHSPDVIRRRITGGAAIDDAAAALELLLAGLVDSVATAVLEITLALAAAEDEFLAEDRAPDTRELIGLRRRAAQAYRMIGKTRAPLFRLQTDPGLPAALAPVLQQVSQRLSGLDADIVAGQNQLKLLRDELDLQAAQRSNQNIYFLSVMTALMMPATLVTGFFGMNTGGLPFAHGVAGTVLAAIVAVLASGGTYFALRMLGLVRRQ